MRRISPSVGHGHGLAPNRDPGRLERLVADQLSDPCFDAIQASQDLGRTAYAGGFPPGNGLEVCQDLIESLSKVDQDMVGICGKPVVRVYGSGGATD